MSVPDPQFVRAILKNIDYWKRRSANLTDEKIRELNMDHINFLRATEFGIELQESQSATSELILQLFPLIEQCGQWQVWTPLLERATSYAFNAPLRIALRNRWGQLLRLTHQLEKAITQHRLAETEAKGVRNRQLLGEARFHLSIDYRLSGKQELAYSLGLKALTTFTNLPSSETWQASVLNTLGIVATETGDLKTAESHLREAIGIWKKYKRETELARSLNNLANVLREQKRYKIAVEISREALMHLVTTASELDKVKLQLTLGTLYDDLEQWPQAEKIFKEANTAVLRRSGDVLSQATQAHNLGTVLLKQGRFAEAEIHLRRSQALWRQTTDKLRLANTLSALAEVLVPQKQIKEAYTLYKEAIALLAEYNIPIANRWREKIIEQQQRLIHDDKSK